MNDTIVMDKNFVKIFYEAENSTIVAKWMGYLKKDMVKEGMDEIIKYAEENGIKRHLSNQLELKILSSEVQQYLVEEVFPAVSKAGISKIAVLVSDDVFAHVTVDKVNNEMTVGDLTIQTFSSSGACAKWLS